MSKSIIDNISTLENLHWGWQKLKSAYANATDIWLNNIEIDTFEGELEENLKIIQEEILHGNYKLNPIYPVAYPKMKDEKLGHRTRPAFYINVRDQLVWISVLNIIGSNYDFQMPFWSFGHRLYLTTWVEGNEAKGKIGTLKYGWYRNTTNNFYRSWRQSWPKFRRHIYLTIMAMSGKLISSTGINELSEQDLRELESNAEVKQFLKNRYLEKDYWPDSGKDLYWCSIDLKKFYPSIDTKLLLKNIVLYNNDIKEGDATYSLICRLLDFKIAEDSGWTKKEIAFVFENDMEPKIGLPTGLIVSGFLSNIAMLGVDSYVQKNLLIKKEFACFRFVDDHVILSNDITNLKKWYDDYVFILSSLLEGVRIGEDKTEPKAFKKWVSGEKISLSELKKKCKLDPDNPSPLVTQTLLKLSLIAGQDISFLTDEESKNMINDLKHFLLTDFADHEIKKETQVSFALTMLSKLLPELKKDYSQVHKLRIERIQLEKKYAEKIEKPKIEIDKRNGFSIKSENEYSNLKDLITINKEEVRNIDKMIEAEIHKADCKYDHQVQKFFHFFINTVLENYSKPKLWLRLIEYCSRVGYKDISEIFKSIDNLKVNDEINQLNYEALNILCITIINSISLKIVNDYYLHNKFVDPRKEQFLKSLFRESNIILFLNRLNGKKFDAKITKKEFLAAFRIVNDLINPQLKILQLSSNDNKIFSFTSKNRNELIFWSYRKICNSVYPNEYWINLSTNYYRNKPLSQIIMLLRRKFECKISITLDYRIINCKWESKIEIDSKQKTLFSYLFESEKSPETNLFYSEYAALRILIELIKTVNNEFHQIGKKTKMEDLNFHPGCFKFNKYPKMSLNSWDELNLFFSQNRNKLFGYKKNKLLPDKRYLPDKVLEYNDYNIAEVYSLGVLLWQLCYKQPILPNELFIDNGRFFVNLIKRSDINYYPSSYSEFIISSCLSPITRESTFWIEKRISLNNFEYSLKKENEQKGFPPSILDLYELERRINLAIKLLQKDQLSIKDNMGRQLVYLSFLKPTTLNDILKDEPN